VKKENEQMKSHITTVFRATILSLALLSNVAWAGYVSTPEVYVNINYAYGSKAGARDSGDGNQYIGCTQYANATGSVATCMAQDAGGYFFKCSTSDPNMLAVIRSETEFSYWFIDADYSGGTCLNVFIDNTSYVNP
jgi:hypothetical protein